MLDPFYLIVDHPRWLERLLPVGVRLVQLRMKGLPPAELKTLVRQGRDLARAHGAQLIVNDYWRLALEEGCDFVHLGQEDLQEADLAAIRKGGLKLGVSTHDDAELDRALATEPDYVALGPIFPTVLKQMRWAPQGLERIGIWKQRIGRVPLVAIGGLTPERGTAALAAGADSVAVVTDVLLNADPEARCREWLDVTRQPT
ncbi:thiamine phosphate synthase [Geminicoccus harenae]|uniref:thiamine phosphate synthase n=1 Tax=Geminicoccus harenae TaxID=2498453 RepID=UPI00168BC351|nr:thiamine phosphate synthase [Geminicoccus harenae]